MKARRGATRSLISSCTVLSASSASWGDTAEPKLTPPLLCCTPCFDLLAKAVKSGLDEEVGAQVGGAHPERSVPAKGCGRYQVGDGRAHDPVLLRGRRAGVARSQYVQLVPARARRSSRPLPVAHYYAEKNGWQFDPASEVLVHTSATEALFTIMQGEGGGKGTPPPGGRPLTSPLSSLP